MFNEKGIIIRRSFNNYMVKCARCKKLYYPVLSKCPYCCNEIKIKYYLNKNEKIDV